MATKVSVQRSNSSLLFCGTRYATYVRDSNTIVVRDISARRFVANINRFLYPVLFEELMNLTPKGRNMLSKHMLKLTREREIVVHTYEDSSKAFRDLADNLLETLSEESDSGSLDGKVCIRRMKREGWINWKQDQWQGFFIEGIAEGKVFPSTGASIGPRVNNGKTVMDVQIPIISASGVSLTVGDFKAHSNTEDTIILNSVAAVDEVIRNYGGVIHFVVVNGDPVRDTHGNLKKWQNIMKGKKNENVDGSRMKVSFTVTDVQVIRLTHNLVRRGIKDGWLKNNFQKNMSNSNGKKRSRKYTISLSKLSKMGYADEIITHTKNI